MVINPTQKISVEALKLQLLKQKTTRERFRIPMTKKQVEDALTAAYQAEVEFRKRICIMDECTKSNISSFASFLTDDGSKFGVMFSGMCGNGKTTLVLAFQNLLNYLNDRGLFDSSDIGLSVLDAKDIVRQSKNQSSFDQLKRRDMIAIEDMGREPVEILEYGNVINPVIDLLEYRYDAQLFTVITTNLVPKEIRERYGSRIADRLNEMVAKIVFENETYRK